MERSDWMDVPLGSVLELKRGYDLPKDDRSEGSVPVVSSAGVSGHHDEAKVDAPGVVTGRYGTIGEVYYLTEPFWPLNTTLYVCDFKGNDPRFASYLLQTIDYWSCSDKGAVPGVNRNHLHELMVKLPPLPQQQAIASILGSLDDKMRLNQTISNVSDETAQAIFNSWFVDFGGGDDADAGIPAGWTVGQLSDLVIEQRDKVDPQRYPEVEFDHFSLPAFDAGRRPIRELGKSIKSAKTRVPAGAVLLSRLNPRFPRVWLPSIDAEGSAVASTEFMVLMPRAADMRSFVYCTVSSVAFARTMAAYVTGTSGSHQRVSPRSVMELPVVVPDAESLRRFDDLVRPLHARSSLCVQESHTLAEVRDALLPALLSGGLRVEDAERIVGRAV